MEPAAAEPVAVRARCRGPSFGAIPLRLEAELAVRKTVCGRALQRGPEKARVGQATERIGTTR
ncbi:hypothetical protein GCM10010178_47600 [Lentzea flava]|uniref:Uncharacterized protein n=1 Tax=Lentzea flava TaxID=103732 RepID=A0ABQ2USA7_9PSEU|nr:hypothetical protein GCM10010178_47600 [Lentzea flava]